MKYLFFDLEYASSRNGVSQICEFGYVVTDETFNILEQDNLVINPNIGISEWDYWVLRKMLTRKRQEYENKPTFSEYYNKIVELISSSDYIFGHSLSSDAKALNDDLQRYNLPSVDFTFFDIKQFYKAYKNTKKNVSVANILSELDIKGSDKLHDAEVDAYNTMLELKEMVKKLEMSIEDLIELCPEAKDKTENFIVESIYLNSLIKEERFSKSLTGEISNNLRGENYVIFHRFLDNVKVNENGSNIFKGKKISISLNYEESHFRQLLNLVQLIVNEGGSYIKKGSESDIFVSYGSFNEDGSLRFCSREKYVKEAQESGANIEIVGFPSFLNKLELTESKLDSQPILDLKYLFEDDNGIKKGEKRNTSKSDNRKKEETFGNSIGDIFGDLLNDFRKEDLSKKSKK